MTFKSINEKLSCKTGLIAPYLMFLKPKHIFLIKSHVKTLEAIFQLIRKYIHESTLIKVSLSAFHFPFRFAYFQSGAEHVQRLDISDQLSSRRRRVISRKQPRRGPDGERK